MAETVRPGDDDELQDLIHRAAQILVDGGVVGIATEATYLPVALATSEAGIQRLPAGCRSVLLVQSVAEAVDVAPDLPRIGLKFARRCWPGPLIMGIPARHARSGIVSGLPGLTQAFLTTERLRLTVSSEPHLGRLMRLLSAPLVAALPAAALTDASAITAWHPQLDLVVDSGPVKYAEGPTVVALESDQWQLEREGVVHSSSLKRQAAEVILFVCTGNTCRSPMAEGLFKQMLAQKLHCSVDELPERGFVISSAGLAAGYGAEASPETLELLQQRGIDLSGHESQPLTERLLNHADFIYTMTRGHRSAILAERPDMADRVEVLKRDGTDVPDPIGGGMDDYSRCQQAIEKQLDVILANLSLPAPPPGG